MPNGNPSWLKRLFRAQKPTQPLRRPSRAALGMEALEERDVPATIITIVNGAVGAGTLDSLLSPTDGTINAADALGTTGSVSVGALQQVGAGVQISITAEQSILFTNTTAANLLTTTANSAQFVAINGDITFGAAANAVTTAGGDLTFVVNSGALTLGTLNTNRAGTAGVGGNISLLADRINIPMGAAVSAGSSTTRSIVTVRPITDTINIDLGGADVLNTALGLDADELGRITAARVLRVGGPTITGTITVTAAITLGANVPTLSLIGGATITDTGVGSLSVANLQAAAANGVALDNNAANDVDTLSLTATAAGADIVYGDVDGFVIGLVDSGTGISTSAAAGASVTLAAGGAVTQAAGANVVTNELELLGAGSFNLSNQGNNAVSLAASLGTASTGTLTYVDADALSVNAAVGTTGITTNNANVTIATVNGDLTVQQNVTAGTAAVALTAGGAGNILQTQGTSAITGGSATLTADRMDIATGTSVNVGTGATNVATLRPTTAGRLIDLGSAVDSTANTLELSDAELDRITAGRVVVGQLTAAGPPATFVNTGNVTISAPLTPANAPALSVFTGGQIISGGGSIVLTGAANLTLAAGTGVGTAAAAITASVGTLEGRSNTGGFFVNHVGNLTVGTGDAAFTGVSVGGGDIVIDNTANLTVSEAVSAAGGGSITLRGITNTIGAPVSATGGNGSIVVNATGDLMVNAAVSAVGSGSVTLTADADISGGGDFSSNAAGTVSSAGGAISVSGVNVTVGGTATSTAGGAITLDATTAGGGDLAVNAAVSTAGGSGNVLLRADNNVSVTAAVSTSGTMGTPGTGTVTVTADFDTSGAGDLTSSGAISAQNGNVSLTAADAITLNAGGTVTSTGGTVSATVADANGTLTVSAAVSAPSTTSPNGVVSFAADNMAIAANVSAGRQVNIVPVNGPRAVDLGTETAGSLSLTDTELDFLLTPIINLGNATPVSTITVTAPITLANVVTTVFLNAGSDVTETGAGSFVMANTNSLLQFFVTGGLVNFSAVTNDVARVSGALFNATSPFTYVDANTVAVTGITTTNGPVTLTSVAGSVNVTENITTGAGTAAIAIDAGQGVTLAANKSITSGDATAGGPITIRANVGTPAGTADIVLNAGSQILTRGDIVLNANPGGSTAAGGAITIPPTAVLAGPGSTLANSIALTAGEDVNLSALAAATTISVVTNSNILDDGDDATVVSAGTNLTLSSGGRVGGTTPITIADVESASTMTPTTAFRAALDVAYGGTLSVAQTGAQGNVQIRRTGAALNTSSVTIGSPSAFVGTGNQFALISAGGALTFDNVFTLAGGNNANALFATAAGGNVVFNGGSGLVNNGATATTTVLAAGSATAAVTGPASDNNPEIQVQNLSLNTTGGAIGAVGTPLEFNAVVLSGRTTGTVNGVAQAGGGAFLTDTANGLALGQLNAGTGNVTLTSRGNVGGNGVNLTAVTPNDNVAEVIGNVVTLDTAPATTNGATGQIGSFSGTAQFFEVNANTINASTNDSRLWISEVGTVGTAGAAVGLISAGADNAILRVRNGGALTSAAGDAGTADVVGMTVVLTSLEAGSFGSAMSPLEIDAATLIATADGAGLVNVTDTVGGLIVQSAASGTGNITVTTVGAGVGLVLGNGSSTGTGVVTTTGGTVTLTAPGAITSDPNTSIPDVSGGSLALTAGTGLGTTGIPLETDVDTLAATSPTGGVFVTNTGALTIGTVGALNGVAAATSGNIVIRANSPLTVAQNVTGTALIDLTAGDSTGTGDDLTINATRTVSTTGTTVNLTAGDAVVLNGTVTTGAGGTVNVTVDAGATDAGVGGTVTVAAGAAVTGATLLNIVGGADADTFNLRPLTGVNTDLDGAAGSDTLNADLMGATTRTLAVDGTNAGVLILTSPNDIDYTAVEFVNTTNGTYALTLNTNTLGFQNGSATADVTTAAAGGTGGANLVLTVGDNGGAPVTVFGGENADVSTLNLTGSTDRDTFVLNLGSGNLPVTVVTGNAPTAAPGDTLTLNTGGAVTGTTFTPGATGAGAFAFTNRNGITFTGIETLPTPIVTVAATDPTAAETGVNETPNTGTFTFTRVGDTTTALTVNFTVAGTAVAGRDFQALGTSVTFAAGSATATVTVTPINNSIIDGTRTVILTLAAGTGYEVGSGAAATVSIQDNDRPVRRFAVGTTAGGAVQVFDDASQVPVFSFLPYAGYTGGVSVSVGDLNGDGVLDIVTGATELSSHVKAFDGVTGREIASFFAFQNFNAGVGVATGDLDGDGRAEIVVGALTAAPHVKAFTASGTEVASFFAFTGAGGGPVANLGVSVGAGDFNGDGRAEILVGTRSQAAHVKTFDLVGNAAVESRSFFAPQLAAGISVAGGDLNGDGIAEILVGGVGNGQNTVQIINPTGLAVQRTVQQGTAGSAPSVAAADLDGNGSEDLLLTLGAQVAALNGQTFDQFGILTPFVGFRGGLFVG